jgi:hypothetical protein
MIILFKLKLINQQFQIIVGLREIVSTKIENEIIMKLILKISLMCLLPLKSAFSFYFKFQ